MASSESQVYECSVCKAVVEVVRGGGGTLVCCKQPMDLLSENTTDAAQEKHVPVIEKVEGGFKVSVGKTAHPMSRSHFIGFIDLIDDSRTTRHYLKPGEDPVATFMTDAKKVTARAWCNLHGLWTSKQE